MLCDSAHCRLRVVERLCVFCAKIRISYSLSVSRCFRIIARCRQTVLITSVAVVRKQQFSLFRSLCLCNDPILRDFVGSGRFCVLPYFQSGVKIFFLDSFSVCPPPLFYCLVLSPSSTKSSSANAPALFICIPPRF